MAVTQGSTEINLLTASLAESISSGAPTRQTLGSKEVAFGWTSSSGISRGFWTFTTTALVDGPSFTGITVKPSPTTPVAKVLEGALKPTALVLETRVFPLVKYAGLSEFTLERAAYSDVLPQAVVTCLVSGALVALERDCAAEAVANAGVSITGDADWTSGILRGIGTVAGNGGNPNLLVMSPADFAVAVDGPQQLIFSGTDAIPSYLGLSLHLSPGIAAGTALVLDSSAFVVAESTASPAVVVDPYSKSDSNVVRIVADVMAVSAVTAPGSVAKIVPTIAGATASESSSRKR